MAITIRQVTADDIQALLTIEQASFTEEEAATKEAFERRIAKIADSFFVAEEDGEIVGLINGPVVQTEFITDDLFAEIIENPVASGHQTILGLAVAPHKRGQGIGEKLLAKLEQSAKGKQRETVTLTCLAHLVSYYERLGYVNKGISSSTHGGEQWFNMSKKL
ncbi:MAG: GNAT family N-acetyltransferase [Solibacillus sp.]